MTKSQPLVLPRGDRFFTRDRGFYRQWFRLFLLLLMQNIITYSVNVADNIMLGAYSQSALSGAAAVNQLQYILQQVMNSGLGEGLVVLGAQLWGQPAAERGGHGAHLRLGAGAPADAHGHCLPGRHGRAVHL